MHGLIFETSICYWQDQPVNCRTNEQMGIYIKNTPSCLRILVVFHLFYILPPAMTIQTTAKAAAASQGKFSFPRLQFSWRDAAVDGRTGAHRRVRRRPLQGQMQALSFIESLSINVVQRTDARHSHNNGACNKNNVPRS